MLKIFEAFVGIGSVRIALDNLNIPYKSVGISEVDKWAIQAYDAIHNEQIELKYKPNVSFDEVEDKIKKSVKEDILNQTTTLGPHKDTFSIYLNNEEIGSFGSYGQQKSVAIALKLAISDIIKNKNDSAIIILDDVFGEWDNKRQDDLIRNLKEKGQVVISTTDISLISNDILKNSKVIEMDEGEE